MNKTHNSRVGSAIRGRANDDARKVYESPYSGGRIKNWQVQELDGTSISDWHSMSLAYVERDRLTVYLQRPFRVRRTTT